jgi:hypothetical protein
MDRDEVHARLEAGQLRRQVALDPAESDNPRAEHGGGGARPPADAARFCEVEMPFGLPGGRIRERERARRSDRGRGKEIGWVRSVSQRSARGCGLLSADHGGSTKQLVAFAYVHGVSRE